MPEPVRRAFRPRWCSFQVGASLLQVVPGAGTRWAARRQAPTTAAKNSHPQCVSCGLSEEVRRHAASADSGPASNCSWPRSASAGESCPGAPYQQLLGRARVVAGSTSKRSDMGTAPPVQGRLSRFPARGRAVSPGGGKCCRPVLCQTVCQEE
jgi:hypothetical protein